MPSRFSQAQVHNVYGKRVVTTRMLCVARAREWGLVESPAG